MLVHLDAWDRSADRRTSDRRTVPVSGRAHERRVEERRVEIADTMERRRESDASESPSSDTRQMDVVPNADVKNAQTSPRPAPRPQAESPLVIIARI